jgi:hypothetical protein
VIAEAAQRRFDEIIGQHHGEPASASISHPQRFPSSLSGRALGNGLPMPTSLLEHLLFARLISKLRKHRLGAVERPSYILTSEATFPVSLNLVIERTDNRLD